MQGQICSRCGAYLKNGYCEYCGWNCPTAIPDKTLTLSGLLCSLTVTRDTSTFSPKVGSPFVIDNKEIAQISLAQASVVGSGELVLLTRTGISQKITFISSQNQNMSDIASYLLHVAPGAQFVNPSTSTVNTPAAIVGVSCPLCKSKNSQSTGESRKVIIWGILAGVLFIITGFTLLAGEEDIAPAITSLVVGGILTAFGFGLFSKKKTDCVCLDCRKKFQI